MVKPIEIDGQEPIEKVAKKESQYWNNFYAKFSVCVPSQFCVMVATEAPRDCPFVEFGCGNGRDSMYMAQHGFKVFAADLSEEAIEVVQTKHKENTNAEFSVCDVSKADQVQAVVQQARGDDTHQKLTLYNRFFMHALDEQQELDFLTALADVTIPGDVLYMEFRCWLDAPLNKEHGKGHFRRYVKTPHLIKLLETLGFKMKYHITGQGMAKFKAEDPFVSRVVCECIQGCVAS